MQIPSSGVVVGKSRIKSTPGSGEALLRGQVKNLLQKVEEEEAHLIKKISVESRPFIHLATSPMGLLAPTSANTPTSYRWSADCYHISRCLRTAQSSSSIISVGLVENSCYAKTQVGTGEYCGLRWSREPDEVEVVMSGISKLLVSQFINLQSGSQNKTIDVCL
ncbi:hypothetical protein Rs2_04761 [Raphanus sativus]|nr:hypothetical protein Rs2_04761 [Raphanus sativus]